jgi:DnaJ-like protein
MMDPYHTLGVRRGCTRDEVKEAFRAMAWRAHPDRGGEELSFIRLCTAYKQILKEVERSPSSGTRKPSRVPRNRRPPKPSGPDQPSGRPPSPRPAGNERHPKPPDATWEPDLVLLDEQPRISRPPIPPDPNWDPDVILLDGAHGDGRAVVPPEKLVATEPFDSWLRRVSARSARPEPLSESGWFQAAVLIFFLALIAYGLLGCWAAWTYDPEKEAIRAEKLLPAEERRASEERRGRDQMYRREQSH